MKQKHRDWDSIRPFLEEKEKILITTHLNPDGDAIGSEIALSHFLQQSGKEVVIINSDPTPEFFTFLDPEVRIQQYRPDTHPDIIASCDGAMILDVSDWSRIRSVGEDIRHHQLPVACIDHHISKGSFSDVWISDPTASSTGELLYDYFRFSNAKMTQTICNALYTCILTDTGSFRFSNTTPTTHRIVAELLEQGTDFRHVYSQVYENYTSRRAVLMGHLLVNMHFEVEGRLVWFVLTQDLLRQTQAEPWETEGFSELPRNIRGVEISLMFSESPEGFTKVSFRSKGRVPINGLASAFGGGGHRFASGALIQKRPQDCIETVLDRARSLLDSDTDSMTKQN